MSSLKYVLAAAAAAVLAFNASPARAAGSIGAGVYASGGNALNTGGAGLLIGTDASVPLVPVSVGLTGFAPISSGGGYAVTLDGKFSSGSDAFGVGYGIGQFGRATSGGTVTAFYDHKLAPLTSIELRGYQTTAAGGGTAGLLALKFSL